jgi:hypothetical protein
MDARHLLGPSTRRHRANLVAALALAAVVGLAAVALDPRGPASSAARRPVVGGTAPGTGPGIVLATAGDQSLVVRPDGTVRTTEAPPAPTPQAVGSYHASASATIGYAGSGSGSGGGQAIGQSAISVATDDTELPLVDALGTPLRTGAIGAATAVGRADVLPGVAGFAAQVASPTAGPTEARAGLITPDLLPLGLNLFGGRTTARTSGTDGCVADGLVGESHAELAGGDLLPGAGLPLSPEDPDEPVDAVGVDGLASSAATIRLEPAEVVDDESVHHPTSAIAVTASARVRVPTITLFPGSYYKTQIRLLAPLEVTATAGGTPGTARAHAYGLLLDPDRPILAVTAYFGTQYLTGRYFQTEDGIHLDLGNGGELEIGATDLVAAAGGRTATGVLDVLRLRLPDHLGLGPVGLSPDLVEDLAGYSSGVEQVIGVLNQGLASLGLPSTSLPGGPVEVRLGHLEVNVAVPVGGVRCRLADPGEHAGFGIQDDDTGHEIG